jgi:acyl-CoA reductase-like NAD-dependent aldehyde dehydrogenase
MIADHHDAWSRASRSTEAKGETRRRRRRHGMDGAEEGAPHLRPRRARAPSNVDQLVMKEPVGPVAAFTPWNFPINQVVRKAVGGARHRLLDHRQGPGGDAGLAAPS